MTREGIIKMAKGQPANQTGQVGSALLAAIAKAEGKS